MIFGFLRETQLDADKAGIDKNTGLPRTGLDLYLKYIFPNINDWVHDKSTGIKELGKKRPDYRSESLKLIIEFDGIQHYKSPKQLKKDALNKQLYEKYGYKVIRLPWFIQLTNKVVEKLFNVKCTTELFPIGNYPSFGDEESPGTMCLDGILKCIEDFKIAPEQLDINLNMLRGLDQDIGLKLFYKLVEDPKILNNLI